MAHAECGAIALPLRIFSDMVHLQQIYLQYGDRVLFDTIDVSISPGEKVGLVGRNGAGKSTLLKLIAGDIKPDSGQIALPKDSSIAYLHQDLLLQVDLRVKELAMMAFDELKKLDHRLEELNAELESRMDYESDAYSQLIVELTSVSEKLAWFRPEEAEAEAEKILKGLGFKPSDFDRLLSEFSGGWQMRVELAKMLLKRPDYLLLDEPTNHLDIESIIWLEEFLKPYSGAVILISHDRQFLDAVTNRTIEIEMGNVYDYKANYSRYLVLREERREKLLAAFENQQRIIADKERTINRFIAKANKTKMAQSMQKQLNKMERIELDVADTHTMNIRFMEPPRSAQVVVKATGISKQYGDLEVLRKVDFQIERGQKVAFVGQNGQGKTTLAKILVKEVEPTDGQVDMGQSVHIGYYAQNQAETLDPNMTLLETMELHAPEELRPRIRGILGAFMFSGEDVGKKVKVLSGGERARLSLALLMLRPINFLLLDEPTNHLDILSKEVLKEALKNYSGTMLVVSHDREFLRGLTDQVVEFRDKQIKTYLGDVDYYLEKKQFADMRAVEMRQKAQGNGQKSASPASLTQEDQKKKERELQQIEKRIEQLEAQISAVEKELGMDGFYESKDSQATLDRYANLKGELDKAMQQWEQWV
jgi:ATP-binding cassette subfamily F protein 3